MRFCYDCNVFLSLNDKLQDHKNHRIELNISEEMLQKPFKLLLNPIDKNESNAVSCQ
jgi:hypothetical protein